MPTQRAAVKAIVPTIYGRAVASISLQKTQVRLPLRGSDAALQTLVITPRRCIDLLALLDSEVTTDPTPLDAEWPPEEIELVFPNGYRGSWRPHEELERLRGCRLVNLDHDGYSLFVYPNGREPVGFQQ